MIKNEKKNKHMTLQERIEIQECLTKGMTFKAIGKRIGKSQTTVSREVKAHLQAHTNSFVRTEEVCPKLLKAPFCVMVVKKGVAVVVHINDKCILPKTPKSNTRQFL